MQTFFLILQITISVLLITAILLQKRSAGLGGAFGGGAGGGGGGDSYYQKRGFEKILYYGTIVLSILFVGLAFAILLA